jgi:hypothetical protein
MVVRQNRLGHADAQTTMDYTNAVTADEQRIAEDLGKVCPLLHEMNREKASARNTDPYHSVRWFGCGGWI